MVESFGLQQVLQLSSAVEKVQTAKGAVLDIPANNIDEMKFGRERRVNVELRDGNEIKGKIVNDTLTFRLSATGKMEQISVDKMKTFEQE